MKAYSVAAAKFGSSTAKEALAVREKVGRWYLEKEEFCRKR